MLGSEYILKFFMVSFLCVLSAKLVAKSILFYISSSRDLKLSHIRVQMYIGFTILSVETTFVILI